jgi:hypothetical protein
MVSLPLSGNGSPKNAHECNIRVDRPAILHSGVENMLQSIPDQQQALWLS